MILLQNDFIVLPEVALIAAVDVKSESNPKVVNYSAL